MAWSNLVSAYAVTRSAQNRPRADARSWQDIKVTAYELVSQNAENNGNTIRRIVQIRYVNTAYMVERSLTVEEEWKYSDVVRSWILETGFPQFQ